MPEARACLVGGRVRISFEAVLTGRLSSMIWRPSVQYVSRGIVAADQSSVPGVSTTEDSFQKRLRKAVAGFLGSTLICAYLSNHLFSTSRSSRLCVLSLGFDGVAEQRIHGLSKCGCDNNRKDGWKCASRIVRIWILAPKTSSLWSIATGSLDGG